MKYTLVAIGVALLGFVVAWIYPSVLGIFGPTTTSTLASTAPLDIAKGKTPLLLTRDGLQKFSGKGKMYNGTDSLTDSPIYLAIVGLVFDVTKGRPYYGEGGGYSFFSGVDATRAFVSGNFTADGLIDTIDDFDDEQIDGINGWVEFYKEKSEGKYFHVGYLIGTYFDSDGKPTAAYEAYLRRVEEAKRSKLAKEEEEKLWPSCDSRWEQGEGTTFSCMSGKLPRILKSLEEAESDKSSRCACVKADQPPPAGKKYEYYADCKPNDSLCQVPEKKE